MLLIIDDYRYFVAADYWFFRLVGIVLAGAIMSSSLLFGNTLHGYRNWFVTVASLFRIILGKFQYEQFSRIGIGGPVFLLSFNIMVNMILINMYISVLNDAFAIVQEENQHIDNEFEVIDYMIQQLKDLVGLNKASVTNGEQDNSVHVSFSNAPNSDIPFERELSEHPRLNIRPQEPCSSNNSKWSSYENDLDNLLGRLSDYNIDYTEDVEWQEHFEKIIQSMEVLHPKSKLKSGKWSIKTNCLHFCMYNKPFWNAILKMCVRY